MTTRTFQKELRRPDEFVSATNWVIRYARDHQRAVTWAGAAVVVAILAVLAIISFRHSRWEQANTDLARAMALYDQKKLPEAIQAFDALASQPGVPDTFADIARLYSAQAQLRQGEFARAAAGFDSAQGGAEGFLQQRALVNHAFALEGNQQFDDAARHFGQAAAAGGPYTAVAVLGEGRNWERAGDKAKAKDAYQKYVSQHPDAPEKALAEARIAALSQ